MLVVITSTTTVTDQQELTCSSVQLLALHTRSHSVSMTHTQAPVILNPNSSSWGTERLGNSSDMRCLANYKALTWIRVWLALGLHCRHSYFLPNPSLHLLIVHWEPIMCHTGNTTVHKRGTITVCLELRAWWEKAKQPGNSTGMVVVAQCSTYGCQGALKKGNGSSGVWEMCWGQPVENAQVLLGEKRTAAHIYFV